MKVTKTLVNHGPSDVNYLASQRIPGVFAPVLATGPSRMSAIAACGIKVEAVLATLERRNQGIKRIPVACNCC
jgi:hypothetical protein